jgi:phosphopantothenoylcysteine decarboxylase/phosphopantothenate--cysteine ligase
MHPPRILLIIGGGIAAYKSLELIRALRKRGNLVDVILTKAGEEFVTKLSASALSGSQVRSDLFDADQEQKMGHIELTRAASLLVVAPATADLLAKLAQGFANDFASTALLAADKRILLAPAMNVRMWEHPATQRNIVLLSKDGHLFVGPNEGEMACGEFGLGRMAEIDEIIGAIDAALGQAAPLLKLREKQQNGPLSGKHIIVTSGPTFEPIDPVRYLANRSSGKQGHAIAAAAVHAGARVTLISGPTHLPPPDGVRFTGTQTARDMWQAVEASLPADVFIGCAAVSDWRAANTASSKIKKIAGARGPTLALVENPDILASVSKHKKRPRLVIGFAAETDNLLAQAQAKRSRKGCDWIIANEISEKHVFGADDNEVHLITPTACGALATRQQS